MLATVFVCEGRRRASSTHGTTHSHSQQGVVHEQRTVLALKLKKPMAQVIALIFEVACWTLPPSY